MKFAFRPTRSRGVASRRSWAGDSSTVAYLVQYLRRVVMDGRAAKIVADQWLADGPDDTFDTGNGRSIAVVDRER